MSGAIPVQLLLSFVPFFFNSCQALQQVVGLMSILRQPLSWSNSWTLVPICIVCFQPYSVQLDESSSAAMLSPHSIAAKWGGNVVCKYNTYAYAIPRKNW